MRIVPDGSVKFVMPARWETPTSEGVYLIHDLRGVHYIGRSCNIRRRYEEHLVQGKNYSLQKLIFNHTGTLQFSWISTNNSCSLEQKLINFFQPKCNNIKYKGAL